MKLPIIIYILSSCTLCLAENLISNGDFENTVGVGNGVLANSIRLDVISSWRCFSTEVEDRKIAFELIGEEGAKALKIEMISNPNGGTGGRIGIDRDHDRVPVAAGDRLQLKYKARLSGQKNCAIMVTLTGHRADGSVASENTEIFELESRFADYEFPEWTVPDGVSELNVVFNLVNSGQKVGLDIQPVDPCGFVIDDIVLEKAK